MLILPWKLMFFCMLIFGSMLAMSSSSWFMAWMGLEINLMSVLALFLYSPSPRNSESCMKYFIVQALASSILISSTLVSSLISNSMLLNPLDIMILLSLFIKVGVSPFHFWLPNVIEGMTWHNNLIMMTWQKVAPFILIMNFLWISFSAKIFNTIIVMSTITGTLNGVIHTSIRKILTFSSINHAGWMMLATMISLLSWTSYMILYAFMLMTIILFVLKVNLTSISSMTAGMKKSSQMSFLIMMMSFGGLPPFLGFLPKWLLIEQSSMSSMLMLLLMVTLSLLTLFFYLRMTFQTLLMKSSSVKTLLIKQDKFTWSVWVHILGLMPCLFLLFF